MSLNKRKSTRNYLLNQRKHFFVTHARFSSFFDLKRGPKVTFFLNDWIKKILYLPSEREWIQTRPPRTPHT